jgi:myo-inositol-1(or 4)-monophosphatase
MPHWSVSIALEHKGEIVAAVIFDAAKDEMFVAEKGAGAWMNDMRIRVSGRSRMSDCVFATGIPWGAKRTLPASVQDLARLMPQCAGMRRWGTASLDLAYVAAGRFDGYWEREVQPYDIAAGILVVREAGGLVEPLRDAGTIFETGAIIAGNGEIFGKFAGTIRSRD